MEKIWEKLPMDLVNKIKLYAPIETPHNKAYKTAVRVITSCELNCNLEGEITLNTTVFENDMTTEEEWFLYLLEQQYEI